jgi:hypothetical protein
MGIASGDADNSTPMPKLVGNLRENVQSNFEETECPIIPELCFYEVLM